MKDISKTKTMLSQYSKLALITEQIHFTYCQRLHCIRWNL